MMIGVYLMSDLDFFVRQNEDFFKYYPQTHNLIEFFEEVEAELSRANLERTISQHQLKIAALSRKGGLTRGLSDPEMQTIGSWCPSLVTT